VKNLIRVEQEKLEAFSKEDESLVDKYFCQKKANRFVRNTHIFYHLPIDLTFIAKINQDSIFDIKFGFYET